MNRQQFKRLTLVYAAVACALVVVAVAVTACLAGHGSGLSAEPAGRLHFTPTVGAGDALAALALLAALVGYLGVELTRRQRALQQASRLATVVEKTGNAIVLLRPDGCIDWVNEGFTRTTGHALADVIGKPPGAVLLGNLRDARALQQIRDGQGSLRAFTVELMCSHKAGHRYWLALNFTPVLDAEKEPASFIVVGTDITTRKRAEEELSSVNRRNELLLNSAGEGIYGIDAQGNITFINPAAAKLTGWEAAELIGKPAQMLHQLRGSASVAAGRDETSHFRRKDGSAFAAEYTSSAADGSTPQINTVVVFRDVSSRRQVEAKRALEARQAALRADVAFALTQSETLAVFLNRTSQALVKHLEGAFARIWTLSKDESTLELEASAGLYTHLNGHHCRIPVGTLKVGIVAKNRTPDLTNDLVNDPHVSDRDWVKREQMVGFAGFPLMVENRLVGVMAVFTKKPLSSDALSQMGSVADVIAQEILRRRAESKVAEQAALLDQARDAIVVLDLSSRCTYWNRAAERLFGATAREALGRRADQVLHLDRAYYEKARLEVLNHGEWKDEACQITLGPTPLTLESRWTLVQDDAGQPRSILIVSTDVTEKKQIEAQFLRTQRMESIGTLAGGIAHDLNNVLSPILMSVELLKQKFSDAQSHRLLSLLESSARRGGDMVKQILSFARGVDGERVLLQTRHLLKEVAKIISETFPKTIQLKPNIPESLWTVLGDATQLHQVLLNLAVNARDAMPHGGTLNVVAENTVVEPNQQQQHGDAPPGFYVLIRVSDTGTGIPREILDRIFEPFFTTKEVGKGTGLGLSTVINIVKSHGGFVQVQTEVGKGTAFNIYLPATDSTAAPTTAEPELRNLPTGRGQTILAVDDEASVLTITKETLETYGYRVITARDGTEAVAAYTQHRDQIKGVITDMLMPQMDGAATIRVLRTIDPKVRVIASSGLMDNEKVKDATGLDQIAFLMKPFTAEKLLQTIHKMLAQ